MTEQVTQQLIVAIVPPFMSGIFTIVSLILQAKLKNVPISPTITPSPIGVSHFVSLGKVLLHAGIVLSVAMIAFFVIFVTTIIYLKAPSNIYWSHLFLLRWISYAISFVWVAAKVDRGIRWEHLTIVALIAFAAQILIHLIYNATKAIVLEGGAPPLPHGFETFYIPYILVQVFVSMGAGGAITNAMKPH